MYNLYLKSRFAGQRSSRQYFVILILLGLGYINCSCIDDKDWTYSQDPSMNCRELKLIEEQRVELCQINEIRDACPTGCGICCEDDEDYKMMVYNGGSNFAQQPCTWIGQSIRGRTEWWCDASMKNNGQIVRDACPFTCDACKSYVPVSQGENIFEDGDILEVRIESPSPSSMATPVNLPSSPYSSPQEPHTPSPTRTPTLAPSSAPSSSPTSTPTSTPSSAPSSSPTTTPTLTPSSAPSPSPTTSPTLAPSSVPTSSPTGKPTRVPSSSPTDTPTLLPTLSPVARPSLTPTLTPSLSPTSSPSAPPTPSPTNEPTSAPTPKKPNLIMILTDEHNYRTLSCYRDLMASKIGADKVDVWGDVTRLATPNIDALAQEGALYTNYYTVAPLCTPSRASFMTGLYPTFSGGADLNHGAMDPDLKTFASVLQEERGYYTGYLGKWHLDGEPRPGFGDNGGRDFGFNENKYRWNRGHYKYIDEVNGKMDGYLLSDEHLFQGREELHYTTDYLVNRGLEFIEKAVENDDPFAVVISIPDPHAPNENRPQYRDMYKNRHFKTPYTAKTGYSYGPAAPGWNNFNLDEVPLNEVDEYLEEYESSQFYQNHMQQYYGMVKCIDDNLGKLMNTVKALGIDEDTIIVFTSDHGDLLFEHGKFNKGKPYDTSAGVPFLIRHPGKIPAGKIVDTAYSSVDFAPTILGLMGAGDTDTKFHGVDGSDELLSNDLIVNDEDKIIISMDTGKTPIWVMAKYGKYKLVVSKGGSPWLFDLARDPDEVHNYINLWSHREIKEKLQGGILEALYEYDAPLLKYVEIIFLDKPACEDNKDIMPLTDGRLVTCNDIGGKVNAKKCENQFKVRNHCPVTCGSCCEDTDGKIIVDGQLYSSCNDLKGMCNRGKVASFCPVTCGTCTPEMDF